jgi:beta-glucanase (GH16 family)
VKGAYTGWHTYGADWEPGVVNYYYDGVLVGSTKSGVTSSPMYLILDYAVGRWGGPVKAPATMKVDYVRVWRPR